MCRGGKYLSVYLKHLECLGSFFWSYSSTYHADIRYINVYIPRVFQLCSMRPNVKITIHFFLEEQLCYFLWVAYFHSFTTCCTFKVTLCKSFGLRHQIIN